MKKRGFGCSMATLGTQTKKEVIFLDGILHESQDFLDYCRQLLQEYSILDSAQLFSLIKQNSNLSKKARARVVRSIRNWGTTYYIEIGNRRYYAKNPHIKPTGRYMAQIKCFWVLIQYIGKVDSHNAPGTFSRIAMEIEGRSYGIVYVPGGSERLCVSHMRRGGDIRYFVVLDQPEQIPLVIAEKVHAYATVSDEGQVEYYPVGDT